MNAGETILERLQTLQAVVFGNFLLPDLPPNPVPRDIPEKFKLSEESPKQERMVREIRSFQVRNGEIFGLLGPNGAGKSTLFSIILKTVEPDAGTVARDIWTMVGYLPQEPQLDPSKDVRGNVMEGVAAKKSSASGTPAPSPAGKRTW